MRPRRRGLLGQWFDTDLREVRQGGREQSTRSVLRRQSVRGRLLLSEHIALRSTLLRRLGRGM